MFLAVAFLPYLVTCKVFSEDAKAAKEIKSEQKGEWMAQMARQMISVPETNSPSLKLSKSGASPFSFYAEKKQRNLGEGVIIDAYNNIDGANRDLSDRVNSFVSQYGMKFTSSLSKGANMNFWHAKDAIDLLCLGKFDCSLDARVNYTGNEDVLFKATRPLGN